MISLISPVAFAAESHFSSIFEIPLTTIDGDKTTLKPYQDKVLLIVNTASQCGYTPQYKELESLYTRYKSKGLVVLGFPSNDFFHQEPGNDSQIKYFCQSNYQVDFPLFTKASVVGSSIQPLFKYLKEHSDDHADVSWNFNKYLIGRDGQVIHHWKSGTAPQSAELIKALELALSAPQKGNHPSSNPSILSNGNKKVSK